MRIFNTLTKEKVEFVPVNEGEVKIYACGPTVYNLIHIFHLYILDRNTYLSIHF